MVEVRDMTKKICVLGDAAVGKTSLIRRFVVDKFDDKYITTIGTKTSKKTLTLRGGVSDIYLTIMIWDVLGQKNFEKLHKSAYKGASGAFIVMDITRKETLNTFNSWVNSLYKITGEIPIVVLANKHDLNPAFGRPEIEAVLEEHEFPYILTSAKTGENVNDAFYNLGKMMIEPWRGVKREVPFEMIEALEREMELEISSNTDLTPLEVEDMIMTRYGELYDEPDFGMSILSAQFKKAGVDFESPTKAGLQKVVDYLLEAAANYVEKTRLEKEARIYKDLLKRIR
jgi:small GTP-binding protein